MSKQIQFCSCTVSKRPGVLVAILFYFFCVFREAFIKLKEPFRPSYLQRPSYLMDLENFSLLYHQLLIQGNH